MNQQGVATAGSLGMSKGPNVGRKPSEISAPQDMIAIGDDVVQKRAESGKTNKVGSWGIFFVPYQFGLEHPETTISRAHSGGGNMVFLDGHVEWDKGPNWIAGTEGATRRWNFDNRPHPEFWKK